MSRYAGGAFGIDITDFMSQGPDFGGMGTQALKDNAQNFGLTEKLSGELAGAAQIAQAKVEAAKAEGKALLAGTPGIGQGLISQAPSLAGLIDFGNIGGGGGGSGADLYGFDPVGSQGNPLGGNLGRMPLNG